VSATVEKIVEQVKALSPGEQEELWSLLADEQSRHLDDWERQVATDSTSGRLDHLLAELDDDIAAGRVKPLHEVIDKP
jgi:hypothetical protein